MRWVGNSDQKGVGQFFCNGQRNVSIAAGENEDSERVQPHEVAIPVGGGRWSRVRDARPKENEFARVASLDCRSVVRRHAAPGLREAPDNALDFLVGYTRCDEEKAAGEIYHVAP